MPRSLPSTLGSAADLRAPANAIRTAASQAGFNLDALKLALTAAANALEQAQTALDSIESRIRELSLPNVNVSARKTPMLVSADRIIGDGLALTQATFSGALSVGVAVATVSGTGKVHFSGDTARIVDASNTPANSAAAGNDGEVRMDNNFIYIHTGGSWRRAAVATF